MSTANTRDWAKSMLPTDLRPLVVAEEEQEISVSPSPQNERPKTLTELLGAIRDTGLVRPQNMRGTPLPLQWPAQVLLDGKSLLDPAHAG